MEKVAPNVEVVDIEDKPPTPKKSKKDPREVNESIEILADLQREVRNLKTGEGRRNLQPSQETGL